MKRNHPIFKESLFKEFVDKIRNEQFTSTQSLIADQLSYRALGTIKSEATSLSF